MPKNQAANNIEEEKKEEEVVPEQQVQLTYDKEWIAIL